MQTQFKHPCVGIPHLAEDTQAFPGTLRPAVSFAKDDAAISPVVRWNDLIQALDHGDFADRLHQSSASLYLSAARAVSQTRDWAPVAHGMCGHKQAKSIR